MFDVISTSSSTHVTKIPCFVSDRVIIIHIRGIIFMSTSIHVVKQMMFCLSDCVWLHVTNLCYVYFRVSFYAFVTSFSCRLQLMRNMYSYFTFLVLFRWPSISHDDVTSWGCISCICTIFFMSISPHVMNAFMFRLLDWSLPGEYILEGFYTRDSVCRILRLITAKGIYIYIYIYTRG